MFFNPRIDKTIRTTYSLDSLSATFTAVFQALVISFIPVLMRKQGATDFVMGLLNIAPHVGALCIFLFLNFALQRDRFHFVSATKAVARAILLLPLLWATPLLFAIFFLLFNIIEMAASPTYTGLMSDMYPVRLRAAAMGWVRIESTIVVIALSLVGGKLFDHFDYRILFVIGILFGIGGLYFFGTIKKNLVKEKPTFQASFASHSARKQNFHPKELITILQKDKLILEYLVIFFFSGFANLFAAVLYPIYLVDHYHITNTFAGLIVACYSVLLIFGYYFWGRFIDRHDPLRARVIQMFTLAIVPLTYLLLQFIPDPRMVPLATFLIFLNAALNGIAMSGGELSRVNFFTRVIDKNLLERYWTIDFFLMGIRGIVAPVLGLTLKNLSGYSTVFIIAFVIAAASSVFMLRYYKTSYVRLKNRGLIELYSLEEKNI